MNTKVITPESIKSYKKWVPSSMDMVLGIFESDGSFQVRTYVGVTVLTFPSAIVLSQESIKEDVLVGTLAYLQIDQKVTISNRKIQSPITGNTATACSYVLGFSTKAGKTLLNAWKKCPPRSPSKSLDYYIADFLALLTQPKKTQNRITASALINQYLNQSVVNNEQIAKLACLWLRFQMSGAQRNVKNKTSIDTEYAKMNATPSEIISSVELGKKVYHKMRKSINTQLWQFEKRLTEDYLIGYHIGDGSFNLLMKIDKNNFVVNFFWSITDSLENRQLLRAVEKYLISLDIQNGLSFSENDSYCRLQMTGQKNLLFFKRWAHYKFPEYRQNQYDKFMRALDIANTPNYRRDLALLEEFIEIKWTMNYSINYKKTGNYNSELQMVRRWYQQNYSN